MIEDLLAELKRPTIAMAILTNALENNILEEHLSEVEYSKTERILAISLLFKLLQRNLTDIYKEFSCKID